MILSRKEWAAGIGLFICVLRTTDIPFTSESRPPTTRLTNVSSILMRGIGFPDNILVCDNILGIYCQILNLFMRKLPLANMAAILLQNSEISCSIRMVGIGHYFYIVSYQLPSFILSPEEIVHALFTLLYYSSVILVRLYVLF